MSEPSPAPFVAMPASPTVREVFQQPPPAAPIPGIQGAPLRDAKVTVPPGGRPARARRPAWPLAVVAALVSGVFFLCVVMALAAGPAFGKSVPSPASVDPKRPDITIAVEEAYLGDMVGEALPDAIDGDVVLDVQPGNLIVATIDFQLLIVRLQVVVNSRVVVEEGRIQVGMESIETGGHDLLDLIGMDQLVLGEDITGAIQGVLEDEMGEGIRPLGMSTDETRVILTVRWE